MGLPYLCWQLTGTGDRTRASSQKVTLQPDLTVVSKFGRYLLYCWLLTGTGDRIRLALPTPLTATATPYL